MSALGAEEPVSLVRPSLKIFHLAFCDSGSAPAAPERPRTAVVKSE